MPAKAKKTRATKTASKKAPARKTATRSTTGNASAQKSAAKRSSARKTAAKKTAAKKTAAKKTAAKKTAAKKTATKKAAKGSSRKTAAKISPRKRMPADTGRRRRGEVREEVRIAHPGAVPESVLRLAQRTTKDQFEERDERHHEAELTLEAMREGRHDEHDEVVDTGLAEPEDIRDELAEASEPGPVVSERRRLDRGDTLTFEREERPEPAVADRAQAKPSSSAAARASSSDVVLAVEDLHVFYGAVEALRGISFRVHRGETVSIIGSNGAGKTTTLKTVSGVSELLKTVRGRISIMGKRVEAWPAHKIAKLGVAHSPEGRKVFPNQTVRDNLMLGAFGRSDSEVDQDIRRMEERFPILGQRRNQPAGLMSGGEQQMLAMARALMARPTMLLFDEPSMGLAPLIVKQIFDIIEELKREGKTILLVEQMAFQALGIADRGYVLETGSITMEGTGRTLLDDPRVKEAYLGA